jgi:hypothetical protein
MYIKEILMPAHIVIPAAVKVLLKTPAGKRAIGWIVSQAVAGTIGKVLPGIVPDDSGGGGGGGGGSASSVPEKRGFFKSAGPYALSGLGGMIQTIGNTAATGAVGAGASLGALSEARGNIAGHLVPESKTQLELYGNTPMSAAGGIMSDVGKAAGVGFNAAGAVAGTGLKGTGEVLGGTLIDAANAMKLRQMFEDIAKVHLAPSSADVAARVVSNQTRFGKKGII